jgi:signal transduction histidine kinase
VAQTGEPLIVNDVKSYPGWSPLADQLTGFITYKIMAVPLVTEGEVLGVIELLNKRSGDFDENDKQLLLLVAASAAIAIQNARRYAALQEAQEQRIASERWTVLGKAAGSLAHRINNTTTLVPIAVQHLRELLQQIAMPAELKEAVDNDMERIERNMLYTVELAAALLRRFRHTPGQAHDVNQLIKQALGLIEFPSSVKLICQLAPDLPAVDTSELLVDALLELLTNALRALEGQTNRLVRIASFREDNRVSIQVTDSGPGIPPEDMPRIFELFYTTHPQGLGFGLWWVKNFLEQQHGQIGVESQPGQGTTFTISLPCRPVRLS